MTDAQTLSLPALPLAGVRFFAGGRDRYAAFRRSLRSSVALLSLLMALLVPVLVAACSSASAPPRQFIAEWQEGRLLFLADGRNGRVRAFSLAGTAPIPLGEIHSAASSGVRDLALDPRSGQLWVLGAEQLELFDARRRQPLGRWPLAAGSVTGLRIDAGSVLLLAADGTARARIDGRAAAPVLTAGAVRMPAN
ncbi:hypothetical protein [Rhodocyclus tenuis]|uniref:Uncharacterized protein n=1 Tax=Rhodocyclus tenuis TaxID=1066 RepID=A0A840G1M5_RHOTE|nr:hypothetical protein [Rhodocyclus tenuis]MBB4246333.1 hypothetical protein [Rhodocyclus tenuis]MBK1681883.1 hypothetical protein [Rhodocyclus tenuis]